MPINIALLYSKGKEINSLLLLKINHIVYPFGRTETEIHFLELFSFIFLISNSAKKLSMEISDEDMTRRKGKILNIFDIY